MDSKLEMPVTFVFHYCTSYAIFEYDALYVHLLVYIKVFYGVHTTTLSIFYITL